MLLHQTKVTALCIVSPWIILSCYFVLTYPTPSVGGPYTKYIYTRKQTYQALVQWFRYQGIWTFQHLVCWGHL